MRINRNQKTSKLDFRGLFFTAIDIYSRKLNVLIFNPLFLFICFIKGVTVGKGTIFNGKPRIRRYYNSTISLGSNCKFNSAKNSISVGIYHPCSFITLSKEAEITFGNNTGATGLKIAARLRINIGDNVLIGANCVILDNDFHHPNPYKRDDDNSAIPSKPIIIEDNVFIGINCTVLKGVTIGKNSVIGANSVVYSDIPENSIAIGNPCKVIMKKRLVQE